MYLSHYPSNTTLVCEDEGSLKMSIMYHSEPHREPEDEHYVSQCTQYKTIIYVTLYPRLSSYIVQVSKHCLT